MKTEFPFDPYDKSDREKAQAIADSLGQPSSSCTNWELSNRLQEIELMDILQLLAAQEITAGKALEAILQRVAGNEPALPEMGSRMPRINVRSEVTDGTATGVCCPTVKRVEQEDDGSFTAVIEEQVAATREWLSEMGFVFSTPGPGAPVTTVDLRSNRTIDPVHPLLHSWEPDFSEGSGPGQCGLCGRLDDTYHVVKREALPDVHN